MGTKLLKEQLHHFYMVHVIHHQCTRASPLLPSSVDTINIPVSGTIINVLLLKLIVIFRNILKINTLLCFFVEKKWDLKLFSLFSMGEVLITDWVGVFCPPVSYLHSYILLSCIRKQLYLQLLLECSKMTPNKLFLMCDTYNTIQYNTITFISTRWWLIKRCRFWGRAFMLTKT